ncbi:MAG: transposase [Ignavibacteria bacterium CG22_combo_CG10-13_8_21_14_all_37_15]|nr:MAG: transposase [Ignavibacteria bacterium CG22_combo_CG10-13_8_21_14_all_37_15]PIS45376.1 MAG: transposase [Ignavibacteria bacterium CG08_land_8_20_14_0_20_37_9]PJC58150.1 MAG: transposase [Ignavibacteria bacterium CG_4_9_14_0_2_um_filter_37_13]
MDKENKSKLKIKVVRNFSEEFKRAKVKELEQKQITISKLVSLYGVSRGAVYKWLYKYSTHYKQGTRLVVELESESKKTERLLKRVCELEQVIGQKQLEIDYLNKLIEVSSDELSVDIKKNFITKHSNGSELIETNTSGV